MNRSVLLLGGLLPLLPPGGQDWRPALPTAGPGRAEIRARAKRKRKRKAARKARRVNRMARR